jgi:hypothetical protein
MAVCLAYFDASGHPRDPRRRQLTVAGYVARESRWQRFERKWDEVLKAYRVPFFHANKMAHWAKPYDTWNRDETKRIAYIQALTKVIKAHVYKAFSHSMSLDGYDAVNAEFRLDETCRPYSLCATQIVRHVTAWMRKTHPLDDVLFVFEKGDLDQGDVNKLLERRQIVLPCPLEFMPKQWRGINGKRHYVRPFEACDLWAYEDGHAFKLLGTGKRVRGSVQHLAAQIPHQRFGYDEEGLRLICKHMPVPKR